MYANDGMYVCMYVCMYCTLTAWQYCISCGYMVFFPGDEDVPLPTADSSVDDQPRDVTLFAVPLRIALHYIKAYYRTCNVCMYVWVEGGVLVVCFVFVIFIIQGGWHAAARTSSHNLWHGKQTRIYVCMYVCMYVGWLWIPNCPLPSKQLSLLRKTLSCGFSVPYIHTYIHTLV